MKAVALLNVRNLAIGIVIAHQRSHSPISEIESPDKELEMAKCSESEPTNIVVNENIVEADIHCEATNNAAAQKEVFDDSGSVSQESTESEVRSRTYAILLYFYNMP